MIDPPLHPIFVGNVDVLSACVCVCVRLMHNDVLFTYRDLLLDQFAFATVSDEFDR